MIATITTKITTIATIVPVELDFFWGNGVEDVTVRSKVKRNGKWVFLNYTNWIQIVLLHAYLEGTILKLKWKTSPSVLLHTTSAKIILPDFLHRCLIFNRLTCYVLALHFLQTVSSHTSHMLLRFSLRWTTRKDTRRGGSVNKDYCYC